MKRLYFLYLSFIILAFSCKSKEKIPVSEENQETALDIPVGKVGVIITIDSLICFKHQESNNFIALNKIDTIINDLKSNLPIEKIVADKTFKILEENNYNFKIVNDFNKSDFPKEDISKDNKSLIDFNSLKKKYKFDDLLLVNVKVGLDQDSTKSAEVAAKTYVTINILDLNKQIVKYTESIGGSKYLNKANKDLQPKDAKTLIYESLNETLDIIDNKY